MLHELETNCPNFSNVIGQAKITLMPSIGSNTVEVSISGAESIMFHAIGIRTEAMSYIGDNYQTWGLPTNASRRIGKGTPGKGDKVVAFSPDGQYLAVASSIGIWLYDTTNYQELALLPSSQPLASIAFSPDGSLIASIIKYGPVHSDVWDVASRTKIATFNLPLGGSTKSIAFSPDGRTIGVPGGSRIFLWDVVTEQELLRIQLENYNVNSISFSPSGHMIAAGDGDNLIRLWNVETGQKINTFSHKSVVSSVAFSPNENILVSGSADTTIKLWDVVTGMEILTIDNIDAITALTFSSDGRTLAWAGAGRGERTPDAIHLWDIATRSPIATYKDPTVFYMNSVVFSPDGKTFATSDSFYDIVKVWDVETGDTIDLGHKRLVPISFSPDSTILASGGRRGLKLWNIDTGQIITNVSESRIRLVAFSPDGRTLAYRVSGEKFTRLWDVTTQTQIGIIENKSIACWAFSPDGKTLASASSYVIKLWDVTTEQSIVTFEGHTDRIESITFSPDGKILASTSRDNTVKLWDVATGQIIENLVEENWTSFPAFSHDGTILGFCTWSYDYPYQGSVVRLWNMTTRKFITTKEADCVDFSPNSTIMVLENPDNSISLWDTKTLTLIDTFEGNWRYPAFSPDGKLLTSMSEHTILLADIESLNSQFTPLAPTSSKLTNTLQTELLPNYPNPFNPETWIPFRLAEDTDVTLDIYDASGRLVRNLDIGHSKAGIYESRDKAIYWDGKNDLGENVASGVYFYHLKAGEYSATKRMVILK